MTSVRAAFDDTLPAGISRVTVRGLTASMSLSSHRLKAMAALLANTMQASTAISFKGQEEEAESCTPSTKPERANGSAKIVWLNAMRLKYFFNL